MKKIDYLHNTLTHLTNRLHMHPSKLWLSQIQIIIVLLASVGLAYNIIQFISQYSVNILFWDQWDLFREFISPHSWIDLFRYQHGPPRMGIGMILSYALAKFTGWNAKAEAYTVGVSLIGAMTFSLILKRRLFGTLMISDVILPFIILTLTQVEGLTTTPLPAHSAIPLLLTVLICLIWLIKRESWRYPILSIMTGLILYTGFGLFAGVINCALIIYDTFWAWRARQWQRMKYLAIACIICVFFFVSFAIGYRWMPAVGCFEMISSVFLKLPAFIMILLSNNWTGTLQPHHLMWDYFIGGVVGIALTVIMVWSLVKILNAKGKVNDPVARTIFILASVTILFTINTAVGRVCLGVEAARASRYLTFLVHGWLALYFSLLLISNKWLKTGTILLLMGGALIPFVVNRPIYDVANYYYEKRTSWKECYLYHEKIEYCDQETDFKLYPNDSIQDRLEYVKLNHLGFYADTK